MKETAFLKSLGIYVLLAGAFVFNWLFESKIVSWVFFALAILFGLYNGALSYFGLAFVLLFGILIWGFYKESDLGVGVSRISLGIVVLILGFLAFHHLIPGFYNWEIISSVRLSPKSSTFSFDLDVDALIFAYFLLIFGRFATRDKGIWESLLKKLPLDAILSCVIIFAVGLAAHLTQFDPKISWISPVWALQNLLIVCLAEELFYRGFIQKEVEKYIGTGSRAKFLAILVTSIFYGLNHSGAGTSAFLVSTVASLCYGTIYSRRQHIESPVLVHFIVNLLHIFFFSYPYAR